MAKGDSSSSNQSGGFMGSPYHNGGLLRFQNGGMGSQLPPQAQGQDQAMNRSPMFNGGFYGNLMNSLMPFNPGLRFGTQPIAPYQRFNPVESLAPYHLMQNPNTPQQAESTQLGTQQGSINNETQPAKLRYNG